MKAEDLISKGIYEGVGTLGTPKKSMQAIIDSLYPDEKIIFVTSCQHSKFPGIAAIAVTPKRVLFRYVSLTTGNGSIDIDLKNISSIDYNKPVGLSNARGELMIRSGGGNEKFDHLWKDCGKTLSDLIKKAQHEINSAPIQVVMQQPVNTPPTNDPLAELEKLADLKTKGIVTEEEFAAKKKQLLGL